MGQETWDAVAEYMATHVVSADPAFADILARSDAAGLPPISVDAAQGKLLEILARSLGARRILEVGTLGGYSTAWLARGLANDGTLVTLELDPHHAAVARENLDRAGVGGVVEIRLGPADVSLAELANEGVAPFDLVFIDANKDGYPTYLERAMRLVRPGSVIVADNVVRGGAVADEQNSDAAVQGVREFLALAATDSRLSGTVMQTVGTKGYDGIAVYLVTGETA